MPCLFYISSTVRMISVYHRMEFTFQSLKNIRQWNYFFFKKYLANFVVKITSTLFAKSFKLFGKSQIFWTESLKQGFTYIQPANQTQLCDV